MKLSDAILLGSLTTPPIAGVLHEGIASCALGMAERAIDRVTSRFRLGSSRHDLEVTSEWPWLLHVPSHYPCNCFIPPDLSTELPITAENLIAHLFDTHIMRKNLKIHKDHTVMTMEDLIEYVRSIEPHEEQYVGRRNCDTTARSNTVNS